MSALERDIKAYNYYTSDSDHFFENLGNVASLSFRIWYNIARLSNWKLEKVYIRRFNESIGKSIKIPEALEEIGAEYEVGEDSISISEDIISGYVIFTDFTRSTQYFLEKGVFIENYTGPILFYSYNMILKDYFRLEYNGEFLEHTGDGSFIFSPDFSIDDIIALLYIAEIIRKNSEEKGLLNMEDSLSLVHIGVSFGNGYMIKWGNEKKFISPAAWEAARYCKEARRTFDPYNFLKYLIDEGLSFESIIDLLDLNEHFPYLVHDNDLIIEFFNTEIYLPVKVKSIELL